MLSRIAGLFLLFCFVSYFFGADNVDKVAHQITTGVADLAAIAKTATESLK